MKSKDKKLKKQCLQPCEVCRQNYFDSQIFQKLTCIQCSRVVHKYCYLPDFKEKDKIKFKCDQCRKYTPSKERSITFKCIVCQKKNGIMKQLSAHQFVHVLCALTSPRIRLNSYKNLSFVLDNMAPNIKANSKTKCWNCHSDGSPGLQCTVKQCSNYSHLDCIVSYKLKLQDLQNGSQLNGYYPSFTTIGLLDKHQNSLLVHLKGIKHSLKSLKLINTQKNQIRYLVCEAHNSSQFFVWCICNKQRLSEQVDQVQCQKCSRWFHRDCMKGQKNCIGCTKNDIYKKNAKLSELIQKAVQIEANNKLGQIILKFLDHFCLKLSQNILKIIEKNSFQVERFYLRKTLEQNYQLFSDGDLQSSKSKIKPLELLYYLFKKQLKDEKQIRVHEIQQILGQLKKDSSFEYNDKSEKIQKKYRGYVEFKRDKILKDDSHEVKYKLQELNKKINKTHELITPESAKQIHEIVKLLDKNERWKQLYLKNHILSTDIKKNIVECFYELKLSQDDTFQFLNILKTISLSNAQGSIPQNQYNKILMHHFKSLAENKRKTYREIIQKLFVSIRIKREYEQKYRLVSQIQQKLNIIQNLAYSSIRDEIITNNLMLSQQSHYLKLQANLIKMEVYKKEINNKSKQLRQSNLQQLIMKIKKILDINKSLQYLTSQELRFYQQSIYKYKFYLDVINFSNLYKIGTNSHQVQPSNEPNYQVMEEEDPEDYLYQINNNKISDENQQTISKRIDNIFKNWPFYDENAVMYGLQQLFILTNQKIKFQQNEENILVFIQNIIEYYNTIFKQNKFLFSTNLIIKLTSLISYSKSQQNYEHFIKIYEDFCKWKQVLEKRFYNIENILQNQSQTKQLLSTIEIMLNNVYLLRLNVSSQCKKLQSIKMWALLSEKIIGHQKITITAAQQIKLIMDKIKYPKNNLRTTIERLQTEAKNINKEINNFLQKNKQQEMQIYEQIAYMKSKISIGDGQILQQKLQSCALDVQVQLQELIEEIKQYKSFTKDNIINKLDNNESLEVLLSLRRKILQNAFLFPNLQQYEKLLVKINQIKIRQFDGQSVINKKQYFKLLNHSGQTRAQFFKNTQNLYKTYKDIQIAENQLLNGKPKWQSLLFPGDFKKIRNQLKNDPIQKSKIQRWISISEKLKEKFRIFRSSKYEMVNYIQLQGQLYKIPINNKELINEISLLKRQEGELLSKVKSFFDEINKNPQTLQIQNHYNFEIIERYRKLSIKNHLLDKFELLYFTNKEIMELGRNITVDNYKKFTNLCKDVVQLQKNNQVLKMRGFAFERMKEIYLSSTEPYLQVAYNLFSQGGNLLGRNPHRTAQILESIQQINKKFDAWSSNVNHRIDSSRKNNGNAPNSMDDDEDINISLKDELNQDDDDEDDIEDDEDDEDLQGLSSLDQFDQDEDEDEDKNNRKRPFPSGNIVQLDDD